jgi:hypothetical protein
VRAARGRRVLARRLTPILALALIGVSGVALGGCDLSGGDGDDTVATTPTTTETSPTAPPAGDGEGPTQPAPTTTNTTTPPGSGGAEAPSGGTGAPQESYDPEKDVEGHDIPPPPGSPAEQFEKECAENPGIC